MSTFLGIDLSSRAIDLVELTGATSFVAYTTRVINQRAVEAAA